MIARMLPLASIAAALALADYAGHGTGKLDKTPMIVDALRCEVRLRARVQKTDAPRMSAFAAAEPALLGSRGGRHERYFVFLVEAPVKEVHDALLRLGARGRVVYKLKDVPRHAGLRANSTPADYMQGDPVQIYVEWKSGDRKLRRAYEDFFLQQISVDGSKVVTPWTPHLVFHGSGVLNSKKTGCIACVHDCPGGIIGNNQYPLVEPRPVLRADWRILPPPGTRVWVVLRPVPSLSGGPK